MTDETQVEAPMPTKKTPKRGIGTVIKEAILARKTNEEALAAAKAEFPEAGTTASTVSWYRNQLRNEGHSEVPTARELKKEAAEAEKAAAEKAKANADAQAEAASIGADPLD